MENSLPESPVREARAPRVNLFKQVQTVFLVGAIMATLYTAWTPLGLFPTGLAAQLASLFQGDTSGEAAVLYPTPTPRPRPRIGIVAGHWGNDSGAVCPDGYTEGQLNLEVATQVKELLTSAGFDVDLLKEFDERLAGYSALALVSIHADSCEFINNEATGYKVAASLGTRFPEKAERLVACLKSRYQTATGLPFHAGSITLDMTSYHAFDEINPDTTAAIIETGFLNLDRQILTQNQSSIAQGIANGVLCFIYNEDASLPPSPVP